MKKQIYVDKEGKAHLRKVFDCSEVMVWMALNFKSGSELARKIRHTALAQLNGKPSWPVEKMKTTHEEAEKTMTQSWGDRVKLVFDRRDGCVRVFVDGAVTRIEQVLDVPAFMELQGEVEMMAMSL